MRHLRPYMHTVHLNFIWHFSEYHSVLVENGVTDYSWTDFQSDFVSTILEQMIAVLGMTGFKPKTFINTFMKMAGEEKAEGFKKVLEMGLFNPGFLMLTSLYVKNKENFLMTN